MSTNQNDKSLHDAALNLFQEGDYPNALSTVEKAIDSLLFNDLLNRSVNAPAILPLGFSGRSLPFDQSIQLAQLELLKARIQEPLQQQGTYDYAVNCVKRCQALSKYAAKNKLPKAEIEKLRQEARAHIAKAQKRLRSGEFQP